MTGKAFVWLDEPSSITTGTRPESQAPQPSIHVTSSTTKSNGTNSTLTYNVDVIRHFTVSSSVKTANGTHKSTWTQSLAYSNYGYATSAGLQFTAQDSNGTAVSTSGYSRKFDYPIVLNYTQVSEPSNGFALGAQINRGQDIQVYGSPVFPSGLQSFRAYPQAAHYPVFQGSHLSTTQNGTASYIVKPASNFSSAFGSTQQDETFTGLRAEGSHDPFGFPIDGASYELYHRHVVATNGSVVDDEESLIGRSLGGFYENSGSANQQNWFVRLPHGRQLPPNGAR